jgi:predicted nucleic acid-binding Zn ribbon protein
MFCVQCGNELEPQARFCSRCGREIPPAPQRRISEHDMHMHINILGWLFVGSGVLIGILGMLILFAGQFIQHMPIPWPPDAPFGVPGLIGSLAAFAGLTTIAFAAGAAAAGIGLLQYRNWGRILAIIMAILLVFKFPIGTGIAIYAFWVLFSEQGRRYFDGHAVSGTGAAAG